MKPRSAQKPPATYSMPISAWEDLHAQVKDLDRRIGRIEKIGFAVLGLLIGSGAVNALALLKALTG